MALDPTVDTFEARLSQEDRRAVVTTGERRERVSLKSMRMIVDGRDVRGANQLASDQDVHCAPFV